MVKQNIFHGKGFGGLPALHAAKKKKSSFVVPSFKAFCNILEDGDPWLSVDSRLREDNAREERILPFCDSLGP